MADQRPGRVEASWKLHDRAVQVIPLGTQTHSKAPREALRGIEPCFLVRGKGGRVWDVDGNEYIDFRSGLGPVILGYCFPEVDQAVRRQLESVIIYTICYPSFSHTTADIDQALGAMEAGLKAMKEEGLFD